jgi:hypothetical protein
VPHAHAQDKPIPIPIFTTLYLGDYCIWWVGGKWEVIRRLRQGLGGLGPSRCFFCFVFSQFHKFSLRTCNNFLAQSPALCTCITTMADLVVQNTLRLVQLQLPATTAGWFTVAPIHSCMFKCGVVLPGPPLALSFCPKILQSGGGLVEGLLHQPWW